jgi:hypothetical protein
VPKFYQYIKHSNSSLHSPLKSVYNMQTCTQGLICLLGIGNLELKRIGDPIPKSHGYVMSMNYRMISTSMDAKVETIKELKKLNGYLDFRKVDLDFQSVFLLLE